MIFKIVIYALTTGLISQVLFADTNLDKKLKDHILPLKKFSYHFEQDQVKLKTPNTDNSKGKIFLVHVPAKTPVRNIAKNLTIETTYPLNVRVFLPNNSNKYAFLIDKDGKAQYRVEMSLLSDLAKDLDLLPKPKLYTESKAQIKSNEIDKILSLETSLYTHLGVIQSNYFTNFGAASSAFASGFGVQAALSWKYVKPLILIDYASYSLRNTIASTFSTWKYGLGVQYVLPFFKQETSISFVVLGDLQYKAAFANNNFELSSNAIRVGIQRVSTTKFADFTYGLDFEKERLTFLTGKNLSFSPQKESVYTVRAHIGLNLDFAL